MILQLKKFQNKNNNKVQDRCIIGGPVFFLRKIFENIMKRLYINPDFETLKE